MTGGPRPPEMTPVRLRDCGGGEGEDGNREPALERPDRTRFGSWIKWQAELVYTVRSQDGAEEGWSSQVA